MERPGSTRPLSGRPPSVILPPGTANISAAIAPYRPLTQHGLASVRPLQTATLGSTRAFKDKRYYMTQMYLQQTALVEEMARLKRAVDVNRNTSASRMEAKQRAQTSAKTYTEKKETLNMYNAVLEMNINRTQLDVVRDSTQLLKEKNKRTLASAETVFERKYKQQQQIDELRKEMEKEQQVIDVIVETLPPREKEEFTQVFVENEKYSVEIRAKETELEYNNAIKQQIMEVLGKQSFKLESAETFKKIQHIEAQKKSLLRELSTTPSQIEQREQFVDKMKAEKADAQALFELREVLDEELNEKQERLALIQSFLDAEGTPKIEKHKELRRREVIINAALQSYPEKRNVLDDKLNDDKRDIMAAVEYLSARCVELNFEILDDIQVNMKKTCAGGLANEYQIVNRRLSRLNVVRNNFVEELFSLKRKQKNMEIEMNSISQPEEKKKVLMGEKKAVLSRLTTLKDKAAVTHSALAEAERLHKDLDEQLRNNDLYQKIQNIDTETAEIEKENNAMAEMLDQTNIYGIVDDLYRNTHQLTLKCNNQNINDLVKPKKIITNQIKKDITKHNLFNI